MTIVDDWISQQTSPTTKRRYRGYFKDFLEWLGKSVDEIVKEYEESDKVEFARKYGRTVQRYYNDKHAKYNNVNTARVYAVAVRSFFSTMLIPLRIKKGKIPESKMAFNEHEFTHAELKSMYQVGTLRDRTWLSVALNLGWGASDFLALARKYLEPYLVESLEYPIAFWAERKKTKTPCRAHLTFEAVQNLRRYFEMTKDEKLCPLTHAGMGYWLKSLAKKANIVPRGRIHFHMLRKFLMSALANANINTWHIKLMVGKSISNDIFTYLKNQTKTLREEYKRAEPNFILGEISNGVHNIFETQAKAIKNVEEVVEKLEKGFGKFLRQLLASEDIISRITGSIFDRKDFVDLSKLSDREIIELFLKSSES